MLDTCLSHYFIRDLSIYINPPKETSSLDISISDSIIKLNLKGIIKLGNINGNDILLNNIFWLPVYNYIILSFNKLLKEDKRFSFEVSIDKGLIIKYNKTNNYFKTRNKGNITFINFNLKENNINKIEKSTLRATQIIDYKKDIIIELHNKVNIKLNKDFIKGININSFKYNIYDQAKINNKSFKSSNIIPEYISSL